MNLDQILKDLVKMVDLTQKGIREVTDGLVNRNLSAIESAMQIEPLTDVLEMEIEKLCVSSIASDFERIGDHITNIAERICFMQTGKLPDFNL